MLSRRDLIKVGLYGGAAGMLHLTHLDSGALGLALDEDGERRRKKHHHKPPHGNKGGTFNNAMRVPPVKQPVDPATLTEPGWRFLTGRKVDIDHIRRELGVWNPDEQKVEHLNVLTIGNERTGQWLAIEALAKPDDIVQTALRFLTKSGGKVSAAASKPPSLQRNNH